MSDEWLNGILALLAGVLAATAAALSLQPLAAFALAGVAVLAAGAAARIRRPAAEPAARRPEGGAMRSGFGRALIETLPTPLLLVSRTGRVVYANPAAQAALPRLEPGAHFAHMIRAPAFVEAVSATIADGEERRVRFAAHQDQERFLEARIGPLPPAAALGPDAAVIVQVEDRTETRRAEQMRSDFVANAGHELRTPLAAIVGCIETLQHQARDDPEARERFLGVMARDAGRMQRLVDDLMSLSRIEMTEHARPVEACSLNDVATESAAALLPVARERGLTLEVDLAPGGARVLGDREQLAQVFQNLIDNAIKYGGEGGQVRVIAAAPSPAHPNRVGVTVEDSGPGIPREHVPRLTERFYRVSAAASRNKGGTGLGLAIVKHILNRHGGRLEVASSPGKGSAFTVWLPPAGGGAGSATPDPSSA